MSTPSIRELRQEYARRNKPKSRWPRLFIGAAICFVGLLLVAVFVVPPIARGQIEKRLSVYLKRDVRVESISLNPLALSVEVSGFSIANRDGSSFVNWRRLAVNFELRSFLSREWRFKEIALEGFAAHLAVNKTGELNFADILASLNPASPSEPAAAKPAQAMWPLLIEKLEVADARIDYADASRAIPFATQIGPMTFELRDFSTGGAGRAPGAFSAQTESGEQIAWKGTVSIAPLHSAGEVTLRKFALKKYHSYLRDFVRFEVRDGFLDTQLQYELAEENGQIVARLTDGTAQLTQIKLGSPGSAASAVVINSIRLDKLTADSAKRVASIGQVAVAGGAIHVKRDGTGIDLVALLSPIQKTAPAPTLGTSTAATPFDVSLGELTVGGIAVELSDTTTPRAVQLRLEDVALSIKAIALSKLSAPSPIDVTVRLAGGGRAHLAGMLAPLPLKGSLSAELEQWPVASVSPYLETFVNLRVVKGAVTMSAKALLDGSAGGVPRVSAQAEVSVNDFSVVDPQSTEEFASWSVLALRGIEFITAPSAKLMLAEIEWVNPAGHLIINQDGTNNLAALLVPSSASAPETPPSLAPTAGAGAPELFIAVDKVTLRDAAFRYLDRSIEPQVHLALAQFSGTIAGLSSANLARADVDLRGKVDGVAPFVVTGQINPLSGDAFTDLKISTQGIDLLPISPYMGKYAGYQLARGSLSLDVRAKLNQRRVESANVATLDQFTLGDKTTSPDATSLPVSLALALLRDRNGRIVIDLPVQGSLDDPNFRIGRVVMRVIGNVFTKVVTSPFALIGSAFGGGAKPDELAFQEFTAGSSELSEDGKKKLDVLARALHERPALTLDLSGGVDLATDVPALRIQELEKGLRMAVWDELSKATVGAEAQLPAVEAITLTPEIETRWLTRFYKEAFAPQIPQPVVAVAPVNVSNKAPVPTNDKSVFFLFRLFQWAKPATQTAKPEVVLPKSAAVSLAETKPAEVLPSLEEMRAKLLAAIPVGTNELDALSAQRVQRVREYLVNQGQAPIAQIVTSSEPVVGARVNLKPR